MVNIDNFFIEVLDNGFVLKTSIAKRAIESEQDLKDGLVQKFKDAIANLGKVGVENMRIRIEIEENVPQVVTRTKVL